jgi:acetyl/propionyl-CoA carboxylase alpha subunit
VAVERAVPGNVSKVLVEPGTKIEPGQVVVVVESMKMEMNVRAVTGGSAGLGLAWSFPELPYYRRSAEFLIS